MACTSHDVAFYLDHLFPGMKDRMQQEMAEVPPPAPTDPTMPAMQRPGSGAYALGTDPGGPAEAPPVLGDLSSTQMGNFEDVRRNLGGSGKGFTFIIMFLIIAVAFTFWYLRRNSAPEESATAAKPAVTETPKPGEKPAEVQKPAEAAKSAEAAKPVVEAAKPVVEAPKPVVEAAKPVVEAPKPAAKPAQAPKPVAAKPTKHSAPAPHKSEPQRALPHLPTPPPPDENPN